MTQATPDAAADRLRAALQHADGSERVRSALAAGTYPRGSYVRVLVDRCAAEPDFTVRETLTWALTRQDRDLTLAALLPELRSPVAQARSQALHTLSKLGDERAWPEITPALLDDADPDVAKTAWRAASGLAPDRDRPALADALATHLGRGEPDLRRSLSRAFVALGADAEAAVERAARSTEWEVRMHALATAHLLENPEDSFETAVAEARRTSARRDAAGWDDGARSDRASGDGPPPAR